MSVEMPLVTTKLSPPKKTQKSKQPKTEKTIEGFHINYVIYVVSYHLT